MKTNPSNHCPQCGQPISQGIKGLCPNCLALVGFGPEASSAQTVLSDAGQRPESSNNPPLAARPLLPLAARYFGDYELLEEIARGGMGVVYRARQTSLNRIVAVKMILSGQLATEADVKRFHTEAEAAANLQHPNIVAIHETGEHEGRHFFSMDYVEGKNLAQTLAGQPLPPGQAAALLKTIAEAVHFAHQRGTLHRDLKPQNVLIDLDGQPRITDFGLAKRLEGQASLTQTGAAMGSPSFMPPEQATGQHHQVGPQSDVYALGAILYQLLTGKPPFAGSTPLETMRQVVETDPTRPSKSNPETPPDLETVCLKCLEKRPERRYHSARELAEELGRFLNHEPILAKPASAWRKAWSWSARNPWAIIGAASMAGIVLLGFAYGLWERVKYFEGGTPPKPGDWIPVFHMCCFVMWPAILLARWLKGRRQRNLPVSNLQLALLAGSGLLLIAGGLSFAMECIRLYVWKRPIFDNSDFFLDSLAAIAGWCLGLPLFSCWLGGTMIWQAIRGQQAHWSGSTTAEAEWLPRQARHYSTVAFVAGIFALVALFITVAYLGIVTGLFDGFLEEIGASQAAENLLLTSFVSIALTVSAACWVYATRKIYNRPLIVSIFLWVLFGGTAVSWFSVPPISVIPATVVLLGMLTGLVGGWVLVKWIKIRKQEAAEPFRPLMLSEHFQWERRPFAITLAVLVVAVGLFAGLLVPKEVPIFVYPLWIAWGALWPASALAVRATTGKLREFFLSMLLMLSMTPIIGLTLEFSLFLPFLTTMPVGMAAGCALIYFGKVRPKAGGMALLTR